MSEKSQKTAESMREKMLNRYGDDLHHKHNKNHKPYRKHFRTHPCSPHLINEEDKDTTLASPTGLLKKFKLRKIRTRLAKGRFH